MIDRSQYSLKNLVKYAIAAIFMVPLIQIVYIGWASVLQNRLPITYWLEYDRFESTKRYYMADEPLTMRSYYKAKRGANLSFLDVLYCDTGDGYLSYSEQAFERIRPDNFDSTSEGVGWVYTSDRPNKTADCYLGSTITLKLEYAQDKKIKRESNIFVLDCRATEEMDNCDD